MSEEGETRLHDNCWCGKECMSLRVIGSQTRLELLPLTGGLARRDLRQEHSEQWRLSEDEKSERERLIQIEMASNDRLSSRESFTCV